jgi:uncharacterized protein YhbP (UPF0306 family)
MSVDVEKIVRENINKTIHMSLGTAANNRPWVCEVHFVYDRHLNLYFRSRTTTRHSQEIAANPQVAGNIVRQHSLNEYPTGLYFEGVAKLKTDRAALEEAYPYFKEQQELDESFFEDCMSETGHRLYKITVQNWHAFGKFEGDKGHKYSLEWNK